MKGPKARKKIAQGTRSETSATLGQYIKNGSSSERAGECLEDGEARTWKSPLPDHVPFLVVSSRASF